MGFRKNIAKSKQDENTLDFVPTEQDTIMFNDKNEVINTPETQNDRNK